MNCFYNGMYEHGLLIITNKVYKLKEIIGMGNISNDRVQTNRLFKRIK